MVLDYTKLKNKVAIAQKQYIILVTCKSKMKKCQIYNQVYINDNAGFLVEKIPLNKYLLKNTQYSLKPILYEPLTQEENIYYVSLMVYSGRINVDIKYNNKAYEVEKYEDNKKQYVYKITKKNLTDNSEVSLNIKANENTFFSGLNTGLTYGSDLSNIFSLLTGSNYVFAIDKQKKIS